MASTQGFVDYVCEQAGLGPELSYRKMFGEYAVYLEGKVVALICDDQLFVKPTAAGRSLLREVSEAPPYPGAKPHLLMVDELETPELLRRVLIATVGALPAAQSKQKAVPKKTVPTKAVPTKAVPKMAVPKKAASKKPAKRRKK
jgi:TfoX/Sxy family transcriptional regulator of competence genes